DDRRERFGGAVVQEWRHSVQPQERRHVEADAPAVAVVINAQSVLRRLLHAGDDGGRRFLVCANVAAERVALAGNAEVERADVAQETVEKLRAHGVTGKCAGTFGEKFRTGGRRSEIFHADSPVEAAVTTRATGVE